MTNSSATSPSNSTPDAAGSRTAARNNYAAPHTPIASAKRPRASMDKNQNQTLMSPGGGGKEKVSIPPSTPLITEDSEYHEPSTPQTPVSKLDRSQMSPMHPPRPLVIKEEVNEDLEEDSSNWVGRKVKVGTIFSPMLNLVHKEHEEAETEAEAQLDRDLEHAPGPDGEADLSKPPHSDSTSLATAQETISHDEAEDEEEELDHEGPDDEEEEEEEPLVEDDGSSQGSLDDEDEFNPYAFIKSLPSYDMVAPLRPPIALPPKNKDSPPISLVLDLDETLVHCTVEPVEDADLVFPVVFHGMTYQVHVRLRPYLFEFLEKIHGKYEVIVFTASQKVYADELLNLIDPGMLCSHDGISIVFKATPLLVLTRLLFLSEGKFIHHRMFRESCLAVEGNFLKDLNVLGRDLSKCVLVDNSPHAFGYQVDNGVPIESWFEDPKDTELLKLERFLRTLHSVKDIRTVIRKTFRTHQLVDEA